MKYIVRVQYDFNTFFILNYLVIRIDLLVETYCLLSC